MSVTIENPGATAIRPFAIPGVPEAELEALRARIADTPLLFVALARTISSLPSEPPQRRALRRLDGDYRLQGVAWPTALPGAPRWEEAADFALSWAIANAMRDGPLTEPARSPLTSTKGALHVPSDDR